MNERYCILKISVHICLPNNIVINVIIIIVYNNIISHVTINVKITVKMPQFHSNATIT